jgi:LmbE family N-acetylglucosaminyl deacetylase
LAVVAHPDDETLGAASLIQRRRDLFIVVATDGAPPAKWDRREEVTVHRFRELEAALRITGFPADHCRCLGVGDLQASLHLASLARSFARLIAEQKFDYVLTHAYEGGHPDHDAIAFAIHHAAALLKRRGREIQVVEMPLYHAGPKNRENWLRSAPYPVFANHTETPMLSIRLSNEEVDIKRRMLNFYVSHNDIIGPCDPTVEHFRYAPDHDFFAPPHAGDVLYENYGLNLDFATWGRLAVEASHDLAIEIVW